MGPDGDKAFLRLGSQTLLARALAVAATVSAEVRILGSAQKFAAYGKVVEDGFPDCGPLGGIHAALAGSKAMLNLMLAVDMPFVESRFLEYLLACARETAATVTVPCGEGKWQPLCAVYRREFAVVAEASLTRRQNRVDALFTQVETRVIADEEMLAAGFSSDMFRNLNTPEDFARAAAL